MSSSTMMVYGFGFECDAEDSILVQFIKKHKEAFCRTERERDVYKEILTYSPKNQFDLDDVFCDYDCDSSGCQGLGAVITNIMSRETGVRFDYCPPDGDCNTSAAVLYSESYPWQMNEVERDLTAEKLTEICKTYMNELGIDNEPDFLAQEYYG